ncbi:YtxH domain-containing protein [Bacillus solitudinis]|uniref:YtxH domain-containing protein n=1 Tax=Bacillus solitudinis TaxID=2014074 RepID=UPI0012FD7148|nr:YtxH domain-containing protein [Bacillus solitudinis]
MNSKSILLGITVGTTLASIATLLTTPKSGKEVQIRCKNTLKSMSDSVGQISNNSIELKQQVKETAKVSLDSAKFISLEMKDSINDWKKDIEPSIQLLKQDIDGLRKNLENVKKLTSN